MARKRADEQREEMQGVHVWSSSIEVKISQKEDTTHQAHGERLQETTGGRLTLVSTYV